MASNAKKLTYWQQHSKRCKTSGLTLRAHRGQRRWFGYTVFHLRIGFEARII